MENLTPATTRFLFPGEQYQLRFNNPTTSQLRAQLLRDNVVQQEWQLATDEISLSISALPGNPATTTTVNLVVESVTVDATFPLNVDLVVYHTDFTGVGVIDTPGEFGLSYGNDADISLRISNNDGEKQCVRIDFESLDLERDFDFVRIYDGTDAQAQLIAELTGIEAPTVNVHSSQAFIRLTSDSSIAHEGFVAKWLAVECFSLEGSWNIFNFEEI